MGYEQIEVKLLDWFPKDSGDRSIAHSAWASSQEQEKLETKTLEDINRVVNQVITHHHDTPKESVWMQFFLRTPIFVERQLDKYRLTVQQQDFTVEWQEGSFGRFGITQNELSGRYRTLPERFFELPKDVAEFMYEGYVENKNNLPLNNNIITNQTLIDDVNKFLTNQYGYYNKCLELMPLEWRKASNPNNWKYKRVREVLRGILGTSYLTDYRILLNLNAFEHIMNQRLAKDTQLESRVTAKKMLDEVVRNKVAEVAVQKMIEVNGWYDLILEINEKTGE